MALRSLPAPQDGKVGKQQERAFPVTRALRGIMYRKADRRSATQLGKARLSPYPHPFGRQFALAGMQLPEMLPCNALRVRKDVFRTVLGQRSV